MANTDELTAAAIMYAGVSTPKTGREEAESKDDARAVLLDELAAKLMRAGCPARDAQKYVAALMEVFRARDVACAGAETAPAAETVGDVLVRYESMTREMLRGIIASDKAKLEAKVNLMARGQSVDEGSMRKLAEVYGLTPAAISAMVLERQERFGLPKNQFNKSAVGVEKYRVGNKRRVRDET